MKCRIVEPRKHVREINEQNTEDAFCANKNSHISPTVNIKDKYKVDYFLAGLKRNADMKASTELTKLIHDEFKDVLQALNF